MDTIGEQQSKRTRSGGEAEAGAIGEQQLDARRRQTGIGEQQLDAMQRQTGSASSSGSGCRNRSGGSKGDLGVRANPPFDPC